MPLLLLHLGLGIGADLAAAIPERPWRRARRLAIALACRRPVTTAPMPKVPGPQDATGGALHPQAVHLRSTLSTEFEGPIRSNQGCRAEILCKKHMLSDVYYQQFELDESVVHHELGHAFGWILQRGIVEQIYFWRTCDNLLAGGMRPGLQLRPGETEQAFRQRLWEENGHQLARRFLAGEVAARRYLGLQENEIFCDFANDDDDCLMGLIPDCERESPDIAKALQLAHENAGNEWLDWIAGQHCEARKLISDHWDILTACANGILQRLPEPDAPPLVITFNELNNALRP